MKNLIDKASNSVKYWYVSLIVGVFLIGLWIYMLTTPESTYWALAWLFSASFIFSGIFDLFFAVQNKKILSTWFLYLIIWIISIFFGFFLLLNPDLSKVVLSFWIWLTFLIRSIYLLRFSFDLKSYWVISWGNVAISSIFWIIISIILIINPIFLNLSIVILTSLAFIFFGVASIMISLQFKKVRELWDKLSDGAKEKIKNLEEEISKIKKEWK